jgi:glycerate dehydrogenase
MAEQHIVVLDGYALNPGDLDWEPFKALGNLTVHERTAREDIVTRTARASYLLTNKTPLNRETLSSLPELRYIGVLATGHNVVDSETARELGICVTNVPAYGATSVAQHTAALMLDLVRGIGRHTASVAAGDWQHSPDWCFSQQPIMDLTGKTVGLVGTGDIALAFARICTAMDMHLIAHNPRWPAADHLQGLPIEPAPLDELFSRADVVSLHCPLTPETQHLVNRARLARMQPHAVLINTARGPLIDELALAEALKTGQLAGAALDVLSQEPPPPDHPLIGLENCRITPHIGWYAHEARARLMQIAEDNLRAFLAGRPVNVVNA